MTAILTENPFENGKNYKLTSRELEVLKLLVQGKTNSEIAEELCISIHTIKVYVANILQKLQVRDRIQAVIKAISEKLVDI